MLFEANGNGQPDRAVWGLYAVAVDETIPLELHVIEIDRPKSKTPRFAGLSMGEILRGNATGNR
jgi:hypothetical protein